MKLIQRWTSVITTRFDQTLSRIENHEAQVIGAIRTASEHAARARLRLARVQRDAEQLQTRIAKLEDEEEKWKLRALQCDEEDRERALECLRRHNLTRKQLDTLRQDQIRHEQFVQKLSSEIQLIDEKINELKRRKNAYAARESQIDSSREICRCEEGTLGDLEELFERWDVKLSGSEATFTPTIDPFCASFEKEEAREELEAQLDVLRKQNA